MNGCSRCQVKFTKDTCPSCKNRDRVSPIKRRLFFLRSSAEWYDLVPDLEDPIVAISKRFVSTIESKSGSRRLGFEYAPLDNTTQQQAQQDDQHASRISYAHTPTPSHSHNHSHTPSHSPSHHHDHSPSPSHDYSSGHSHSSSSSGSDSSGGDGGSGGGGGGCD